MCLELSHNRVVQALEDLVSSMESGHNPQVLLYDQFLVRKMWRVFDMVSAMEIHLDSIVVFM